MSRRLKIIKHVRQEETLPPFYGVAWFKWNAQTAVCLPVPLNLIAAAGRSVWLFLKNGHRSIPIDPRSAYDQGRQNAINQRIGERRIGPYMIRCEDCGGNNIGFAMYRMYGFHRILLGTLPSYLEAEACVNAAARDDELYRVHGERFKAVDKDGIRTVVDAWAGK